ncbi:MAG: phosphotransferase, partial [Elusimicrobia bacterium]|nr:phosphotransferase [Elusimicrobiota bacterium]
GRAGRLDPQLQRLASRYHELRGRSANGVAAAADVKAETARLSDVGALPEALDARRARLGALVKDQLGLDGPVEVVAPKTAPKSGDQVFLARRGGKVVGVVKVLRTDNAGHTLLGELAAGEAIGRLGPARSRVVAPHAAFRAGTGEYVYIMEAAPGRDLYASLRAVGEAPGAEARGRALADAGSDVEGAARALGELHRISRSERPGQNGLDYDVGSARRMLAGLKGEVPDDLYRGLEARVDSLGRGVAAGSVPGAVTHGDAHPGNFFSGGGPITLIDVETAVHSIGPEGRAVGNPASDVGRFLESMRLNNESMGLHLSESELSGLERRFMEGYAQESGLPPAALERDVAFYRLRLALTAMSRDAEHRSQYEAAARSLLKDLDAVEARGG